MRASHDMHHARPFFWLAMTCGGKRTPIHLPRIKNKFHQCCRYAFSTLNLGRRSSLALQFEMRDLLCVMIHVASLKAVRAASNFSGLAVLATHRPFVGNLCLSLRRWFVEWVWYKSAKNQLQQKLWLAAPLLLHRWLKSSLIVAGLFFDTSARRTRMRITTACNYECDSDFAKLRTAVVKVIFYFKIVQQIVIWCTCCRLVVTDLGKIAT